MSALKTRSNSLAGLTLDAVLSGEIALPPPPQPEPQPEPEPQPILVSEPLVTHRTHQTLLDIIREEQKEGQKVGNTWTAFREKLRLKRAGAAWVSSYHIPASDIVIPETKHHRKNHLFSHRKNSAGVNNDSVHLSELFSTVPMSDPPGSSGRAMFTRGSSMRVGSNKNPEDCPDVSMPGDGLPSTSFKSQLSRHDSVRDHAEGQEETKRRQPVVKFVEERTMSARDAVAAQEASEAEAAAAAAAADEDEDDDDKEDDAGEGEDKSASDAKPVTMSLMDLLEETDRQMGLTGSRYAMDDDDEYDDEEEYEEDGQDGDGDDEGEFNCCACAVKIKGAPFIPCGHTFCKLCSKELLVQKGHCPVCSSFVIEFLEIF